MAQRLFWCCTVAFVTCGVGASQQLVQELLRTEVVYPQEQREWQVTLAPAVYPGGRVGLPISMEYGITSTWQVGMRASGIVPGTRQDEKSLELGVRRSFMNIRRSGLHLAFGLDAEIERPQTEDDDETPRQVSRLEVGPSLAVAKDLFRRSQVFIQMDSGFTQVARQWSGGGMVRTGPVVITNEFTGVRSELGEGQSGRALYWTPGLVWRLPSQATWEVAGGVSFGLNSLAESHCVVVKLTREFDGFGRFFR